MDRTSLEDSIRYLRDIEEIRYLKHRYANLCDDNYATEALLELFTSDAVWSGPADYGHHEGRTELRAFFDRLGGGSALFTVHMVGNEEIRIEADTATGRWTTIAPCTFRIDGAAEDFWGFLRYEDKFVRQDGRWLISHIRATALAGGSHLTGWSGSFAAA
jgi:hypothetical protein